MALASKEVAIARGHDISIARVDIVSFRVRITIIGNVLPFSGAEGVVPFLRVKVREVGVVGIDGLKPIVKDDVVLRSDLAALKREDASCDGGMKGADANVDAAMRASFPTRKFVSVRKGLVENIYRTTPYVKVLKLGMRMAFLGEDLDWRTTTVGSWNVINDVYGMKDCKWPKGCIAYIRPMKGGMM